MSLAQKLDEDFLTARKNKDEEAVKVLTMVKAAMRNKEIEQKKELSDDDVQSILNKEIKQRKDAIGQYTKGGREELAKAEESEVKFLEKYLPEQMAEEEVTKIVTSAIEETGAKSMADIGKVMGKVMPQVKGQADGAVIQKIVRLKLSN
ncbi:GatB/YqeY domain-containing protein [Patescibacteria group bacterium]